MWLTRDGGWVGVRAEPDDSGRRLVRLQPVTAADLGTWVAPYVAQVLA